MLKVFYQDRLDSFLNYLNIWKIIS
jgi:hypothetical protein